MVGRATSRIFVWSIISVLTLMPLLGPAQPAGAENPTALVTVSVSEYDEETDSLVPVADSCVLVSIWIGQVGRYCDGAAEDTDPRTGFIGIQLPAGMLYTYELDMEANLPDSAYSTTAPYGALREGGAEVLFEGVSCSPWCPPFLSYFVSLPTGDEPNDEFADGMPVVGACFILRLDDGSTLPEQCSEAYGVSFSEVDLNRYTIEPTRLPEGCTVAEITVSQPFEVTQELIDYALSGNSWGNFYAGEIYLSCEPEHLASLTVAVVQCPENTAQDRLTCDGIPLAGIRFTFEELLMRPHLLTGADGMDTVTVVPGQVSITRMGTVDDPFAFSVNFVVDVTCTERGSEQVLVNERINGGYLRLGSSPGGFTVAAGDDVVCTVIEYTGAAVPSPDPTDEP